MKFILWTLIWFILFEIDSFIAVFEFNYSNIKILDSARYVTGAIFFLLWIPLYLIFIK